MRLNLSVQNISTYPNLTASLKQCQVAEALHSFCRKSQVYCDPRVSLTANTTTTFSGLEHECLSFNKSHNHRLEVHRKAQDNRRDNHLSLLISAKKK